MPPVRLTDEELTAVFAAAQPIPVSRRDAFLRDVAAALKHYPEIGPGVVYRVVSETQRQFFDPPLETERHEPQHSRRRVGEAIGRERNGAR
jgi:hypothetical protein